MKLWATEKDLFNCLNVVHQAMHESVIEMCSQEKDMLTA